MATVVIRIGLPPAGELETSGDGWSPADYARMSEEAQLRQNLLDLVSPYLESLPKRSARRQGDVLRVELLGSDVWSQFNHYLLLVTADVGETGIEQQLPALLPEGSKVSVVGASFQPLQKWQRQEPLTWWSGA